MLLRIFSLNPSMVYEGFYNSDWTKDWEYNKLSLATQNKNRKMGEKNLEKQDLDI